MGKFKSTVVFVLVLTMSICSGRNWFEVPCGPGCADSVCYIGLGCTTCQSGFCRYYSVAHRISTCVLQCADGQYCHQLGFCTACGVDRCKKCSGRRRCTECKSFYYLDNSSSFSSECVSSYECRRSGKSATTENGIRVCK